MKNQHGIASRFATKHNSVPLTFLFSHGLIVTNATTLALETKKNNLIINFTNVMTIANDYRN